MGVARRTMSVAIGVGVLFAGGAIIYTGQELPASSASEPQASRIGLPAPNESLICPALPELPTLGEDGTGDFDPEFAATARDVALDGSVAAWTRGDVTYGAVDKKSKVMRPKKDDFHNLVLSDAAAAGVLSAKSTDDAAVAAGSMTAMISGGDLEGLTGAACVKPTSDSYILGGSTATNDTARLMLVNPGDSPITVSVSLWGPTGQIKAAGASDIVVPAHAQRRRLIEGLESDLSRVAVRVQSSGGPVGAYLQDSRRDDNLRSAGSDFVTASDEPRKEQVIAGISAVASTLDDANPSRIRILAPGTRTAHVTIRLVGMNGEIKLPGLKDNTIEAGEVSDIDLHTLPTGTYAAFVSSDEPIVAAAQIARPGSAGQASDFAWVPSSRVYGSGALTIPSTGDILASFAGERGTSLTVRPVFAGGKEGDSVKITVGLDGIEGRDLQAFVSEGKRPLALRYRVENDAEVALSLVVTKDISGHQGVTVLTPSVEEKRPDSVSVRPAPGLGLPGH